MLSFLVQALREIVTVPQCNIEYVKILLVLLVCLHSGTGSARLSVSDLQIRSMCTSGKLLSMMVSINHLLHSHQLLIACMACMAYSLLLLIEIKKDTVKNKANEDFCSFLLNRQELVVFSHALESPV